MKKEFIPSLLIGFLTICMSAQDQDLKGVVVQMPQFEGFSGVLSITRAGTDLLTIPHGYAVREFGVLNTIETKFRIASVTKYFTSVIIMQLVEEGKMELGKSLNTYLPDYPGPGGDKITIHHLLNHTSGLPYIGPSSAEDAFIHGMPEFQLPHTIDALIELYAKDLVAVPGEKFSYNNGEYIILGRIIERLCAKPFEEVLEERILRPLDMHNSGLLYNKDVIDKLAIPYFTMDRDLPVYIGNWYTAGAMYSNAEDLGKFSKAL